MMNIISVNCSTGKTVFWKGISVQTSIFKIPVEGPVAVRTFNLAGDKQSDLSVHGGADKAVYLYSMEHYSWWEKELNRKLAPGMFGENLTTEGLDESSTFVGDILKMGTAILQVVQPRLPCYKLGIRFEDEFMPKRFMKAGKWGMYFRVLEEGIVQKGDSIEFVSRDPQRVSIPDLVHLAYGKGFDPDLANRALAIESLSINWRETLNEKVKERVG